MAHDVTIVGSPCTARVRHPAAVIGLTVITAGIYAIYWWYAINRELRDFGRARAVRGLGESPGLSALAFSGLSILTMYVAFVWTIVATTRRVQRAQAIAGCEHGLRGWIGGLLWVFTLTIGGIAYTQGQINKVWELEIDKPAGEAERGSSASSVTSLHIEDPDEWPAEHPALWDKITRRAYNARYGKPPGA
jgi:hypothetical protein